MRKLSVVLWLGIMVLGTAALATGRWDGSYQKVGSVLIDGGEPTLCMTGAGNYVKAVCPYNVNISARELDGGAACSLSNCEHVNFLLGEKWYSQLTVNQKCVSFHAIDAGAFWCHLYKSSN